MGITKSQIDEIRELRSEGMGYKSIADELGLSKNTVKKYCEDQGMKKQETFTTPNVDKKREELETTKLERSIKTEKEQLEHEEKRRRREKEQVRKEEEQRLKEIERVNRLQREKEKKDQWLAQWKEKAVTVLNNILGWKYKHVLKTKHILDLKQTVEDKIDPFYKKESDQTVEAYIKELVEEFYDQKITTDPVFKKQKQKEYEEKLEERRENLLRKAESDLFSKSVKYRDILDWDERRDMQEDIKGFLAEEIDGTENETEIDNLIDREIEDWISENIDDLDDIDD